MHVRTLENSKEKKQIVEKVELVVARNVVSLP